MTESIFSSAVSSLPRRGIGASATALEPLHILPIASQETSNVFTVGVGKLGGGKKNRKKKTKKKLKKNRKTTEDNDVEKPKAKEYASAILNASTDIYSSDNEDKHSTIPGLDSNDDDDCDGDGLGGGGDNANIYGNNDSLKEALSTDPRDPNTTLKGDIGDFNFSYVSESVPLDIDGYHDNVDDTFNVHHIDLDETPSSLTPPSYKRKIARECNDDNAPFEQNDGSDSSYIWNSNIESPELEPRNEEDEQFHNILNDIDGHDLDGKCMLSENNNDVNSPPSRRIIRVLPSNVAVENTDSNEISESPHTQKLMISPLTIENNNGTITQEDVSHCSSSHEDIHNGISSANEQGDTKENDNSSLNHGRSDTSEVPKTIKSESGSGLGSESDYVSDRTFNIDSHNSSAKSDKVPVALEVRSEGGKDSSIEEELRSTIKHLENELQKFRVKSRTSSPNEDQMKTLKQDHELALEQLHKERERSEKLLYDNINELEESLSNERKQSALYGEKRFNQLEVELDTERKRYKDGEAKWKMEMQQYKDRESLQKSTHYRDRELKLEALEKATEEANNQRQLVNNITAQMSEREIEFQHELEQKEIQVKLIENRVTELKLEKKETRRMAKEANDRAEKAEKRILELDVTLKKAKNKASGISGRVAEFENIIDDLQSQVHVETARRIQMEKEVIVNDKELARLRREVQEEKTRHQKELKSLKSEMQLLLQSMSLFDEMSSQLQEEKRNIYELRKPVTKGDKAADAHIDRMRRVIEDRRQKETPASIRIPLPRPPLKRAVVGMMQSEQQRSRDRRSTRPTNIGTLSILRRARDSHSGESSSGDGRPNRHHHLRYHRRSSSRNRRSNGNQRHLNNIETVDMSNNSSFDDDENYDYKKQRHTSERKQIVSPTLLDLQTKQRAHRRRTQHFHSSGSEQVGGLELLP